jgi:hypothetical protein
MAFFLMDCIIQLLIYILFDGVNCLCAHLVALLNIFHHLFQFAYSASLSVSTLNSTLIPIFHSALLDRTFLIHSRIT